MQTGVGSLYFHARKVLDFVSWTKMYRLALFSTATPVVFEMLV